MLTGAALMLGAVAAMFGGVQCGVRFKTPGEGGDGGDPAKNGGGGAGGAGAGGAGGAEANPTSPKPVQIDVRSILASVGASVGENGVIGNAPTPAPTPAAQPQPQPQQQHQPQQPFTLKLAQDVANASQDAERTRVSAIMSRAAYPAFKDNAAVQSMALEAVNKGWSPETFADRAMAIVLPKPIGHAPSPDQAAGNHDPVSIEVGQSQSDKITRAAGLVASVSMSTQTMATLRSGGEAGGRMAMALGFDSPEMAVRAISEAQRSGLCNASGHMSLKRLAVSCVAARLGGINARDRAESMLLSGGGGEFMTLLNQGAGGGHASGDFPKLFAGIVRMTMLAQQALYTPQWEKFCDVGVQNDFREDNLVSLSEPPKFKEIKEGESVPQGTFNERGEVISVETYGMRMKVGYRMIVNDNMGVVQRMISSFASMAAFVPDDLVGALLSANSFAGPTLRNDGLSLFHATHKNLAGSGAPMPGAAALSYDTVRAGRQAMLEQTGFGTDNIPIDVDAKVLIVPRTLKQTADDILRQEYVPGTAGAQNQANLLRQDGVQVAMLRNFTGTRWWLAAMAGPMSAIEVRFLFGQRTPSTFVVPQTDPFGTEIIAWVPGVGAAARGFEGIYTNPGA